MSPSECFTSPSCPSAPILPEHPTIVYHVEQTMTDSGLDSVNKRSPDLNRFHPNIKPSPSPPPDESLPKCVPSTAINREDDRPGGTLATSGDAVLIASLGDGENPEIARLATKEGLPPDQGDEDPMKNVTIPGSQVPENPTLKRLQETAFGSIEQDGTEDPTPARKKVAYQQKNKTTSGHPNGKLLPDSVKGGLQVFYTNDTSVPEEAS